MRMYEISRDGAERYADESWKLSLLDQVQRDAETGALSMSLPRTFAARDTRQGESHSTDDGEKSAKEEKQSVN